MDKLKKKLFILGGVWVAGMVAFGFTLWTSNSGEIREVTKQNIGEMVSPGETKEFFLSSGRHAVWMRNESEKSPIEIERELDSPLVEVHQQNDGNALGEDENIQLSISLAGGIEVIQGEASTEIYKVFEATKAGNYSLTLRETDTPVKVFFGPYWDGETLPNQFISIAILALMWVFTVIIFYLMFKTYVRIRKIKDSEDATTPEK